MSDPDDFAARTWLAARAGAPTMPLALRTALLLLPLSLAGGCKGDGHAPVFDGVSDQVAAVGAELVIELRASDADGDELSYTYDVELDGLDASISRRPDGGGVFRWTPLAEHVGTWYFDFVVSDGHLRDTITVAIDVRATLGQGAVPVFREPLGSGTTLDLAQAACIEVPIVIEDQDDSEVAIAIEAPGLEGGEIVQDDGLHGRLTWCPNKQAIADDRHPVVLSADDGDHDKTLKDFLIVLRRAPKPDCPGEAPVVEHAPVDLATVLDLELVAHVTDDMGLKQAPLLYSTLVEPSVPVDFAALDVVEMELVDGDLQDGSWRARLPNPVAAAPEGSSASLYYIISAGDNDDLTGDCDHVTDAPSEGTFSIVVTNDGSAGGLGPCEACSADAQCGRADDLCVAMGVQASGRCTIDCDVDADCDADFDCQPVESVDGAVAKQCMPTSGSCVVAPPACEDDAHEDNDSRAQAQGQAALPAGDYGALVACDGDDDWYRVVVTGDTTIGALIDGGATTNLNLGLYAADGTALTVAEGASSFEAVEQCVPAGTYYVRVYAFGDGDNTYDLLLETSAGACTAACVDDDLEPDDTRLQATYAEVYPDGYSVTDRMICSGDDDWYEIALFTGEAVVVDLTFTDTVAGEDLDLHFHDDAGVDLTPCTEDMPATCTAANGQSGTSNEHYEFDGVDAGCTPCTYYVRVHGFDGSQNDYDLSIALQ